jgi:solute carrier family 25 (mitochondrial folate transporter), member 32
MATTVHRQDRLHSAQGKGRSQQSLEWEYPWAVQILSAMVAGATSTICTCPLWVIKTRFMVRVARSLDYVWRGGLYKLRPVVP